MGWSSPQRVCGGCVGWPASVSVHPLARTPEGRRRRAVNPAHSAKARSRGLKTFAITDLPRVFPEPAPIDLRQYYEEISAPGRRRQEGRLFRRFFGGYPESGVRLAVTYC